MKIRSVVLCGLFAALLCLCSWLCLPVSGYRFTLQTFGVLLTLGLLGGKNGCLAIGVYLLLGIAGLPVFSGFRGGISVLLEPTGGFLWGFLLGGLLFWLLEALRCHRLIRFAAVLLVCYAAGTAWFALIYGQAVGISGILLTCVLPYLLPDGLKLLLALVLIRRLKNRI